MSRDRLDYTARQAPAAGQGFDPDVPVEGFYRYRMRSGAVPVAIRIWHGQPLDPIDGSVLDRSYRFNATANGQPVDLSRVWPRCASDPITEAEATYLATLQAWGEANAPDSPQADPHKPVDFLTAPLPF